MMGAMTTTAPATARGPVLGVRVVTAMVAGIVLAFAFPPFDMLSGWIAVPAFAGLVASVRGLPARRAGGWLSGPGAVVIGAAGATFFLVLLTWMRVLGPDAWIALVLLCALFWAAAGVLLPALLVRRWWVLSVPLLWVCMEALRARVPWGGFPWGRLAFAQAGNELVGWAALGGAAAVTFVVALAGTLLLLGWDRLRSGQPRRAAVAALAIAALVGGGAAGRAADWGGPDGAEQQIAVVQGNVPRLGLDFNAQRRAVLDNHVRVTEELATQVAAGAQPPPVAVIWPENSSDIDPLRNADAARAIDQAADAIGAPILVGAVQTNPDDPPTDAHPGTVWNVGLVWDPVTGPGDAYVKRHPVPFGEYLPFRDLLSRFITRFDRIPRDFAPGSEPGLLQIGPVPAGVVICFEIAYDELVRDAVRAGGQVLVVQTNNATYGRTGQPAQQLAISQVQAVASGRTTLVAATSGVSAVIDPHGVLQWQTEEFTSDSTVTEVPMRSGLTPAMRIDGWLELAAAALLVGLLVVAGRRRGREDGRERRSRPAPNRPTDQIRVVGDP